MVTIDYCGYHTHNLDQDLIFRPSGTASYLFLLVLSPMTFTFQDGTVVKARSGACILYPPGCYQHYQADREFFNSYVHFFCDKQDLDDYSLRMNELFYPQNIDEIHWILKKIYQEYQSQYTMSDKMTAFYIEQMLILLHRSLEKKNRPAEQQIHIYPELLALREQMLGNCAYPWNVEQLCQILNIGKSQLYKYYTLFFHITPKDDLIQARLQKAKYLISKEDITIKQAALESGFQNICHFNRLFRNQCGCTPSEYRQQILNS